MNQFNMRAIWVLLVSLVDGSIVLNNSLEDGPTPFVDWDYIVYSQRWLITDCTEWEERNSKNTCSMPSQPASWGVHGVWPSKIGADGPFFCNSAMHFDMSQLQPMMTELMNHWPNIEANTKLNSFWKHEWDKHGTCAATLNVLNSVTNFFRKGLELNQQYKLADILSASQIVPNSQQGYTVENIFEAVRNTIGKNPMVDCVVDSKTKESLISEIRICFNKDFDVIDCNVTKVVEPNQVLSNCNLKHPVMYWTDVPPRPTFPLGFEDYDGNYDEEFVQKCLENYTYRDQLLKWYEAVRFLTWFTL